LNEGISSWVEEKLRFHGVPCPCVYRAERGKRMKNVKSREREGYRGGGREMEGEEGATTLFTKMPFPFFWFGQ